METSATIGKLAEALCKAQAGIVGAKKDAENPFFHSSYADLSSVWDACRPQLTAHGLSVVQTLEPSETKVCVTTMLLHSSGEWIRGSVLLNPVKTDPQAMGSAITYARRYSLAAIVGVCPSDDDDGNGASGKTDPNAQKPPAKPQTPKAPARDTNQTTGEPVKAAGALITDPQRKRMFALAGKAGLSKEASKTLISRYGFESSNDVTKDKYEEICKEIESFIGDDGEPLPTDK
jgi:hypothetical protein